MTDYNVSYADLQASTGWGRRRITTLLNKEPTIQFVKVRSAKGGNGRSLFAVQDLLPRLSQHKLFTEKSAIALIALDQERRLQK